jgi:hypothetical protein
MLDLSHNSASVWKFRLTLNHLECSGVKHISNFTVNVRAFFFGRVLGGCYGKEGVINQKGQITPKSSRLSNGSGYLWPY